MTITIDHLRRFAVARSLFTPTTLQHALDIMGFVQADPIRAPARAQDLTLRHRVNGYRAGDLERHYTQLDVEEDFFINYGFVTRRVQALMHPRSGGHPWGGSKRRRADDLMAFVHERGTVHPREVDAHFAHGTVTNYWGGSSSATTHLLDAMHYQGLLRVARRESGIRLYAPHAHEAAVRNADERRARLDALVDVAVALYGPVTASGLGVIVGRLRYAAPQWKRSLKLALLRAKRRLDHATVDGVAWYWPAGEIVERPEPEPTVRLLAPFDPIVWDRKRFERLWGWGYRFEAYTPLPKRRLGYYALPLLWKDQVIGWANVSVARGTMRATLGYVSGSPPRDRLFRAALGDELERMRDFLGLAAFRVLTSVAEMRLSR